ncbi:class I SAM-dependent methyltransferase [Aurantimonas sp. VKM B-3413]|uniref:class I SAM-dependent methyltransferase n=1 Tax=Aurantimonas sp. VKM B-3413 TaxID=2779401 RepID=UPI001E5C73D5|nr:class I SAM-dependent methyltransferase [Aurantimonas sp. VKM B-3413]MCB8837302.1 class I SAM-dependent methyltransferase [Aurantimonas sp. VKM B-3413]
MVEPKNQPSDRDESLRDLDAAIASRAWDAEHEPDFMAALPTMLTRQELRMLAFLARHLRGSGPILDLGCFVGGSTLALAHGVLSSSRPDRMIHSFDLFELNEAVKHRFLYSKGLPLFPGEDGLELFSILTASAASIVRPYKGDVLETLPAGLQALSDPPALVFLDLCKSPGLTDMITRTVFPRLKPGAIIVQQDFIYEFTPWATYPFWVLKDRIDLLGHCDHHSVVFRVREPIPAADAERACLGSSGTARLIRSLEEVAQWLPFATQRRVLADAARLLERHPQAHDEWTLMTAARRDRGQHDRLAPWRVLIAGVGEDTGR